MKTYSRFIIHLLFMLSMMQTTADLQAQTRHNGLEWLEFGPAVVTAGKAIRITLQEGDREFSKVLRDEQHLKSVKSWILKHFSSSLNRSPVKPNNSALEFQNIITIYASKEAREEDILLQIPLTSLTLGVGAQEYARQLQLLRALVEAR